MFEYNKWPLHTFGTPGYHRRVYGDECYYGWSFTTVYPKKYAHGFCFAVLCCGYTLTDFPISIRLTSLALWQSYDCPSASRATLMNMDKYFMGIHYERLRNHNKAKHNKTVCIFLEIYCMVEVLYPRVSFHQAVRRLTTNYLKMFDPNVRGLNCKIFMKYKSYSLYSTYHWYISHMTASFPPSNEAAKSGSHNFIYYI